MAARARARSAPRKRAAPPKRAAAKRAAAKGAAAKRAAAKGKPANKAAAGRPNRRPTKAPAHQSRMRRHRRLAVAYDTDGPRVRLGLLWFVCEMASAVLGVVGIAVLFSVTAGVAAMQTARCWRKDGARPSRQIAGAIAALLVPAAAFTTGLVGLALLVGAVASVLAAFAASATARRRQNPWALAGVTVRCWLFAGFAAACVVLTARFSLGGAIALLLVVAAYETGDYIVGSGAANPYEGPVAGATAILVVTFAITAVGVRPFTFPESFLLGALAAVLCPVGQLMASLVLPHFDSPASALRRLDSLLLLAPAWALVVGVLVK
ncbi:MAG: hypothetical protein ABIV94_01775 [Acidimicrobiales bacterium]